MTASDINPPGTSRRADRGSNPNGRSSTEGIGRALFALGGFGGFLIALFVGVTTAAWAATGMDDATVSRGSGAVSLDDGARIYRSRCAQCHGADGSGGVGVALGNGAVVESFPDFAAQIALIENGRGTMPSFGSSLSAVEIESVARYEREVLGR